MILFSKEELKLSQQNIVMLEIEDDAGFIYMSLNTYNQAILLNDRFETETVLINRTLGVNSEASHNAKAMDYFFNVAPEPLHILTPFLGLVKESVTLDEDMEQLCGVLHQMSMVIDFNEFTKVPADIRAQAEFSKSMVMGYKNSWEDMIRKLKVNELDKGTITLDFVKEIVEAIVPAMSSLQQPVYMTQPVIQQPVYQQPQVDEYDEDEEDDDDEVIDIWAQMDAIMKEESAKEGKREKEEEVQEAEEVVKEEEHLETTKELSAIDKLTMLYGGVK